MIEEIEERKGIEGFVFDKMDEFIAHQAPYNLVIKCAIVELGLIYDEQLYEDDEALAEKPDQTLSKDEAIALAAALFNRYKDTYDYLLPDYWKDTKPIVPLVELTLDFIKEFGEPYKEYLEKYAP